MTSPRQRFAKFAGLDFRRLRPYGDSLATPAVRVWLGFAWVVILLMASIEGAVWGLIGASIVPQDATWLKPVTGVFMFALMFTIIWIVDASLIMSERPALRAQREMRGTSRGIGALMRWMLGVLVRIFIIAVSLYVTAPFLAKLIRADDIAAYHQREVEQYYAQRTAMLQEGIRTYTESTDLLYRQRIQPLEEEIARLNQTLTQERERRARIDAESAPEIAVLQQDLAAARERFGNELMGRHGRPEGRGPEARKWETHASTLEGLLTAKQSERDTRGAAVARRIGELEHALNNATQALRKLTEERQQRLDQIAAEATARQPDAAPPRLTFAARSRILQTLRTSPDEAGVPHFETVEGFSQAALTVLFLALLALKLFEPTAVSAYFNENLQLLYRKYLEGGLADIPGFEPADDLEKCLNPVEFARYWQAYENDPAAFHARRQALLEVRAPLLKYQAEQSFEQEEIARRRERLDREQAFEQRRRELELDAYHQELTLRTAQLQAQIEHDMEIKRRSDAFQARTAGVRIEIDRLRDIEKTQDTELATQREAARDLDKAIETLRGQVETMTGALDARRARAAELERLIAEAIQQAAAEQPARKRFWTLGGAATAEPRAARDSRRELKILEKAERLDAQRLERLRDEFRGLELRKIHQDREWHAAEARLAATRTRIRLYEDSLSELLGSHAEV